ncbi:MAG: hypothetical protein ACHQ4H_08485 [Ktedonobacterales bacterium]
MIEAVVWGMRRRGGSFWALCALLLSLACAACGTASTPPPSPPAGSFSSASYHFRLTYPTGWKLTTLPNSSSALPLTLEITDTGSSQADGAFLSTFTLSVINLHDRSEATPAAQLEQQIHATGSPLKPITLAGHQAYQDAPTQRTSPDGSLSIMHTDYYLLTSAYEYALSTDAVSGDNAAAALRQIVSSFALLP